MTDTTDQAIEDFIEQMGLSAEMDGWTRIAGRMWGFFIVHGGPCSFAELAEKLQVSRGSISTNARMLRELGIIDRVSMPGDRQDYYRLADHPYPRMLQGYVNRMRSTVQRVERLQKALPDEWNDTQARLREMHHFHDAAVSTTEELIHKLTENKSEHEE